MQNDNLDDDIYDGILQLIGAMFRLAAQDYKHDCGKKEDVLIFIESDWFFEICDYLDVSPKEVQIRILKGIVKQRSEYR